MTAPCSKESDLYAPIKQWLEQQQYTVRSEVRHCDVVGVRESSPSLVIIEIKKTFTLTLILQAIERKKTSPFVYIAAEHPRKTRTLSLSKMTQLCQQLGIGLLSVTFFARKPPFVACHCDPWLEASIPRSRRTQRLLREFQGRSGDYTLGGQTRQPIVSAYREKALKCAYVIHHCALTSPKEIRDRTHIIRAGDMIRSNPYGWFEKTQRGHYQLTLSGKKALITYAHVVQSWEQTLQESVHPCIEQHNPV